VLSEHEQDVCSNLRPKNFLFPCGPHALQRKQNDNVEKYRGQRCRQHGLFFLKHGRRRFGGGHVFDFFNGRRNGGVGSRTVCIVAWFHFGRFFSAREGRDAHNGTHGQNQRERFEEFLAHGVIRTEVVPFRQGETFGQTNFQKEK
jgi:hypothetical protein